MPAAHGTCSSQLLILLTSLGGQALRVRVSIPRRPPIRRLNPPSYARLHVPFSSSRPKPLSRRAVNHSWDRSSAVDASLASARDRSFPVFFSSVKPLSWTFDTESALQCAQRIPSTAVSLSKLLLFALMLGFSQDPTQTTRPALDAAPVPLTWWITTSSPGEFGKTPSSLFRLSSVQGRVTSSLQVPP